MLLWRRGTSVLSAANLMVSRDPRLKLIDGFNLQIENVRTQDGGDYICQIGDEEIRDQVHTLEILGKLRYSNLNSEQNETLDKFSISNWTFFAWIFLLYKYRIIKYITEIFENLILCILRCNVMFINCNIILISNGVSFILFYFTKLCILNTFCTLYSYIKFTFIVFFCLLTVPPSLRSVPQNGQVTARKGSTVTLECKASGNPVPNIFWHKKVISWRIFHGFSSCISWISKAARNSCTKLKKREKLIIIMSEMLIVIYVRLL